MGVDPLPVPLYHVASEVQQVRGHVYDVVQDAVLLLVARHAPLALLTLGARVAALTQAVVGLNTHATVTTGRLAFSHSAEGSLPAGAAATLPGGGTVSVLTLP